MSQLPYHFETLQLHAGQAYNELPLSRAVPTYQTSAHLFGNFTHPANLITQKKFGNVYSRIQNSATDVFEKRITALEGGVGALAVSSGQAAQFITLSNILKAGDNFISTSFLDEGTYGRFKDAFKRLGIEARFAHENTLQSFGEKIDENTKAIYLETIGDSEFNIPDFNAFVSLARTYDLPLIVDNTYGASGYFFRPIEHGANIVVQSATKWICGHGSAIGGVIVDGGNYNWNNGKFPQFTAAVKEYNNLKFWELFGAGSSFGNIAFIVRARVEGLRDFGASLSPFNSFLLLQGLETLSLRVQRQSYNALAMAQWLEKHPLVEKVNYPGLESSPYHQLAKKYLRNGFGSALTFYLKGGEEIAAALLEKLKLISALDNTGNTKTFLVHSPAAKQQFSYEEELATLNPLPLRLSVGIEHIYDLKADFEQAFKAIKLRSASLKESAVA